MNKKCPIGIFDSGVGGLTIASAIRDRMPNEALLYFGDTAHMPYGDKSEESIRRYSLRIAEFLIEQGAKAIVIACNSASVASAGQIQERFGKMVPIVNVIDPLVNYVTERSAHKRIGIIGTKATIQSQVYPKRIWRKLPGAEVCALATPLLAPLVEEGLAGTAVSREALNWYLNKPELSRIDSLLLACTHYPVLHEEIQGYYRDAVEVIDAASLTAEAVEESLAATGLLQVRSTPVAHRFFVSERTDAFERNAQRFFGQAIQLRETHLPGISPF